MRPLALVGLALAVTVIITVVRTAPGDPQSHQSAPESAHAASIDTFVSRQDSEGVTEAQMSQVFLANLEAHAATRIKAKIKDHYAARGEPAPSTNIRSESTFIEVQGKKLAIVRIFEDGVSNSAMVTGIIGTELVRLLCTTRSTYQIEVTTGPCGAKLSEVFAVSFHG